MKRHTHAPSPLRRHQVKINDKDIEQQSLRAQYRIKDATWNKQTYSTPMLPIWKNVSSQRNQMLHIIPPIACSVPDLR